ncbi:hypothetical protein C8R44DRAFT_390665 [Mycena epipterygia]|nr:hypothetical protein C8R44DRAFT_390665 [Mycena epipterygia]
MWPTAFLPYKLVRRLLPASPHPRKHQRQASKPYKPAPLRSNLHHFHQYKKREQAFRASSSRSSSRSASYSSSSSSSSDGDATVHPTPPPVSSFEPEAVDASLEDEGTFLHTEFARLHFHNHWRESVDDGPHRPLREDLFAHPSVQARLERQRLRDIECLRLLPTQAPPLFYTPLTPRVTFPRAAPPQPSTIVQKWNERQARVAAWRADQQVYAQMRRADPAAARWARYEAAWAKVRVFDHDAVPVRFCDIPWPVKHICYHASHIAPIDVHQFVIYPELEPVSQEALRRLSSEIKRWHPDHFRRILPLVCAPEQAAVAEAAGWVLEILIQARQDIKSNRQLATLARPFTPS